MDGRRRSSRRSSRPATRSRARAAPRSLATREGGGLIDLARADVPLLFAAPTGLSFGAARPGADGDP